MTPYYEADRVTLHLGDCRDVMRALPDASVDAIVTDPPYGLGFMGKKWDSPAAMLGQISSREGSTTRGPLPTGNGTHSRGFADNDPRLFQQWCETWAAEALRVLKPGGHLAAYGGTRTYHRMACAIEDAGFEIRDTLAWMYGSGFPKSLDVYLAFRPFRPSRQTGRLNVYARPSRVSDGAYPRSTSRAAWRVFSSWARQAGTALKPAYEPIVLARKPLAGTVAANVLAHGTGAINVDGCRIAHEAGIDFSHVQRQSAGAASGFRMADSALGKETAMYKPGGRWPANVLMDEEAAALLDATVGTLTSGTGAVRKSAPGSFGLGGDGGANVEYGDTGGPSRFFYTSKASRSEREAGLEFMPRLTPGELTDRQDGAAGTQNPRAGAGREQTQSVKLDAWVSAVLEAVRQADTERFLARVTDASTSPDDGSWSTTSSGSASAAPSLTDSKSTTSTATSSTTASATSSPLIPSRTSDFIRDALSKMASGSSPAVYAASVSRLAQRIGISAEKAGPSTDAAARAISERLCALSRNAAAPARPQRANLHPTVKPVDVMAWLCRLVTPPGGLILDPFNGSGTTGMAALDEGFRYIGIEREERYIEIARHRITHRHLIDAVTVAPTEAAPMGRLL